MTITKSDLQSDNTARFNQKNASGVLVPATGGVSLRTGSAQSISFLRNRGTLDYITIADRAYIVHDLPKPVVRDIFGSGFCPPTEPRIDWEGIAIGAFLAGYLIFVSAVILKIAAFGIAFPS